MDLGHLLPAGAKLDDPKRLTRLLGTLIDKIEATLRTKLGLNVSHGIAFFT